MHAQASLLAQQGLLQELFLAHEFLVLVESGDQSFNLLLRMHDFRHQAEQLGLGVVSDQLRVIKCL